MTGRFWRAAWATIAMFGAAPEARAQTGDFVPPAGYSGGGPLPALATPIEPGTPALAHLPEGRFAGLFALDPDYRSNSGVQAKVIGAYAVDEPKGTKFVEAWAIGFLPVNLKFSDGSCFRFRAEYTDGMLANARLNRSDCDARRPPAAETGPPPPADRGLRPVATSWGYGAWADDRTGTTLVTAPFRKDFAPFLSAKIKLLAFMAMNSVDAPLGNVTMVARIGGKLTIMTLLVAY